MCVWCAGIGKNQPALALFEMGRRIEGMWAGAYTGLASLDQGHFRIEKTIGDCAVWEKSFSANEFPGNTAIFHSRTCSGGPASWAHPFISTNGLLILAAQGSPGIFRPGRNKHAAEIGNLLLDEGYKFTSATPDPGTGRYPVLKDGRMVHSTEISTNYIEYFLRQGFSPMDAMIRKMNDLPEESVDLCIFKDYPGKLWISNMNQSVVWSRTSDGIFLSSTALAFPDSRFCQQLPNNTAAVFSADGIEMRKINPSFEANQLQPAGLPEAILEYLRKNASGRVPDFCDHVTAVLVPESGKIEQRARLTWRAVEQLCRDKYLVYRSESVMQDYGAPVCTTRFFLANQSAR